MEPLNTIKLMKRYAKAFSKFCMYISWNDEDPFEELIKAAPYLEEHGIKFYSDDHMVLIFNTKKEMVNYFDQTVGDDGPTKLNSYDGPVRVYALTCSDQGELWNENT